VTGDKDCGHGPHAGLHAHELRVLVRLLAGDHAGAERLLAGQPGDLERLVVACGRAGLSAVLLRALAGSPWLAALSADGLASLREQERTQAVRQQEILRVLAGLADGFTAARQPLILLKGPYLSARLYGDPLRRAYADLDLLALERTTGPLARLPSGRLKAVVLAGEGGAARAGRSFEADRPQDSQCGTDLAPCGRVGAGPARRIRPGRATGRSRSPDRAGNCIHSCR